MRRLKEIAPFLALPTKLWRPLEAKWCNFFQKFLHQLIAIDVKENLKKLEISRCISSRNDKQSCKNFFKNYQAIVSLYTKNIREYQIAISEKGHWWKTNFRLMCYLGGSKLSKKSTFKFIAKCMGHEASSGACENPFFGPLGPT